MKGKLGVLGILASLGLLVWALTSADGQTGGYGTIVLKVPADATVTIGGKATTQKGSARTYYTPDLAPGFKYQYEFTITWKEAGKEQKKTEWIEAIPGKTVTRSFGPGPDTKVIDPKKDDAKKDDKKKDDAKKDTAKKDDAKKDDGKKDTAKKDDSKKDDFKKDGLIKDATKKDDAKKDAAKKDDGKDGKKVGDDKKDAKKDDAKKDGNKDDAKDKGKEGKGADEAGFTKLFSGTDLKGFHVIPKEGKNPFNVEGGVINVAGNPAGYFYTDKSYKNFVLRFDWKFLKDGNSGLLVHIQEPHKVWPKSIEVQGQQNDHGRIFAISGAKGKFTEDNEAQKKAIKVGEWNTTEVISQDGRLTSKVNGIEVSTGEGELKEGPLGWQSEGAPLQFKNIRIKVLD